MSMRSLLRATLGKRVYDLPAMLDEQTKRPPNRKVSLSCQQIVHALAYPTGIPVAPKEMRELALSAMDASTEANLWPCWRRRP